MVCRLIIEYTSRFQLNLILNRSQTLLLNRQFNLIYMIHPLLSLETTNGLLVLNLNAKGQEKRLIQEKEDRERAVQEKAAAVVQTKTQIQKCIDDFEKNISIIEISGINIVEL
jgi:hypothetical protein